jgi:hypothetical protein
VSSGCAWSTPAATGTPASLAITFTSCAQYGPGVDLHVGHAIVPWPVDWDEHEIKNIPRTKGRGGYDTTDYFLARKGDVRNRRGCGRRENYRVRRRFFRFFRFLVFLVFLEVGDGAAAPTDSSPGTGGATICS